jgi:O-antigen/teichoic acid export membrane protein
MLCLIDRLLKSVTVIKIASVFLNNGLRQALALVISVFIARTYGPSGQGEYALFTSLTMVIALICSLGLVNALVFMIKKKCLTLHHAAAILFLHSSIAILVVIGVITVGITLANPVLLEINHPIWLIGGLFFFYYQGSYLNLLLTNHLLANGDIRNHRRQMVAIPLITFGTLFAGNSFFGTDDFHPIIALVVGEFLTATFFLAKLIKLNNFTTIRLGMLKEIYCYALRSYLAGLTGTILSKLDNIILGVYAGVDAVGLYSTAKSLTQFIQSVPMAFSGYLLGLFVERGKQEGVKLVLRSSATILLLTILVALPILLAPSWMLNFIYGPEFVEVSYALMILAVAAVAFGASSPILGFLNANNRPGASSVASVISAVLTVTLLLIFVPTMSYNGAAIANLIGSLAILALRYWIFLSHTK